MNHLGTTIKETIDGLRGTGRLGGKTNSRATMIDRWHAITRIAISFILLIAGIWFAKSGDPSETKVGMTMIGFVAGYWLK